MREHVGLASVGRAFDDVVQQLIADRGEDALFLRSIQRAPRTARTVVAAFLLLSDLDRGQQRIAETMDEHERRTRRAERLQRELACVRRHDERLAALERQVDSLLASYEVEKERFRSARGSAR